MRGRLHVSITLALLGLAACDLGAVPGETFDAGPPGDAGACIPAVATGDNAPSRLSST